MKQQLFNLKTLHLLGDGSLDADFKSVLASLVKDCLARPTINKVREVKLVVSIKPKVSQDGTCDDVVVNVQVASKAPAKAVQPYIMRATVNGGLKYSPDSPESPDQAGMFDNE